MACLHPNCDLPIDELSGTHSLCLKHYIEWHNGYAEAYGWPLMREEDIINGRLQQ
jgi:hypothetical protein